MRLDRSRQSSNVEDRRRAGPRIGRGGGLGIGGILVVLAAVYFGVDPAVVMQFLDGAPTEQTSSTGVPPDDPAGRFVAGVLGETEDTWRMVFREQTTGEYREPVLVLFRGATPTACGTGQSAMGPFYCPADARVYIDLTFFEQLDRELGAPGDFAQAYVIAHEIGHHVQNLTGAFERYARARQAAGPAEANAMSVRMELQADCYAGVWAHHADAQRGILEPGDIEEAIKAASAVGDDTLQRRAQGRVVPDSFTHGTSAQRIAWFRRGFDTGRMRDCETANAPL